MPFSSPKQRRFMHAQHPEIANRWEKEAKRAGINAVQPPESHRGHHTAPNPERLHKRGRKKHHVY